MVDIFDRLPTGEMIEMIEISPDDYKKWCVRCTKEMWIDFSNNTIKPCSVSDGVDLNDFDGFIKYIEDINNTVERPECNYCHSINPNYRLEGNTLWTTPGHGNCHVEFILSKSFNNSILDMYVRYIAKNNNKFACICVSGKEPGNTIIEQNHIELIAKPFYKSNQLQNRVLRYDFKTDFEYSIDRTKRIISYMRYMQRKYPGVDINIQPSEKSLKNDFYEKLDLFVKMGFEIVARTDAVKNRIQNLYYNKEIHLTIET